MYVCVCLRICVGVYNLRICCTPVVTADSVTRQPFCSFGRRKEGRKEMFYLTTHTTHFIYGYIASDIW